MNDKHLIVGPNNVTLALGTYCGLGDGGLAGMEHIHNHLTPAQQPVRHVFPRTDGNAAVNHSATCNR